MKKIIACIDGSTYADSVVHLSAWAQKRTNCIISLLHVVAPHSELEAKIDMSGQIGIDAKSNLLKELTNLDEEHGKLELKKGQLMISHAKEILEKIDGVKIEILHRRGSLVETIQELEEQADLIIMGKRGEQHHIASDHLGSNLERVARSIHKPLLVSVPKFKPIKKYLIAYDGSISANKAVDYAANSSLLKGLECHLLKISNDTPEAKKMLKEAEDKLNKSASKVFTKIKEPGAIEILVNEYIADFNIDCLLMGAYGHSKIRSFILGSITTSLIHNSQIPVMLFR